LSDRALRQTLLGQDKGSTLYITLGNSLRSDDGVGPYIAGIATGIPGIRIRDAEERPERALDWAMELRPATLVFIDAADFGGAPGEIRALPVDALEKTTFSTHRLPLPAIMDWIAHETGAVCSCIGIQLGSAALGGGLTPSVQRSADRLVKWLSGKEK
jgi:hydrogenase 3 maturation protease